MYNSDAVLLLLLLVLSLFLQLPQLLEHLELPSGLILFI